MDKPPVIEGFDCVEFKHKASARIYEAIRDLTPEQEVDYWREVHEEFVKRHADATARIDR